MKNLLSKLMLTTNSHADFILRLTLGIMILPHGLQKTFGLFGGYGFTGTMDFFTKTMGLPMVLAFLAIVAEFLGGLGLIFGLFTRVAAFGVGTTMLVAALTSHIQNGFFMNWFGNQKGEGIEFHILALGIAAALVIRGGGKFSLDRTIAQRSSK
jgi:putative oxidoreductase